MMKRIVAIVMTMFLFTGVFCGCGASDVLSSAKGGETYDGNNMSFSYDDSLLLTTYDATDEVKNVTASDKEGNVIIANTVYKSDGMKSDVFFEQIYDGYSYSGDIEESELLIDKSNADKGLKA